MVAGGSNLTTDTAFLITGSTASLDVTSSDAGFITVNGTLSMTGNARILTQGNNDAFILGGGLSMTGNSKIDLAGRQASPRLFYTTTAPLDSVRDLIQTGFNGGD
jgi:hypothetical protein